MNAHALGLAVALNQLDLQCRQDIPDELLAKAKERNLVIVYAVSDDLMEFEGAIQNEFYDKVYLNKDGVIKNDCDESNCPYFAKECESAPYVSPIWFPQGMTCSYDTNIDCGYFEVKEDGEMYCIGIVFSLDDMETEGNRK